MDLNAYNQSKYSYYWTSMPIISQTIPYYWTSMPIISQYNSCYWTSMCFHAPFLVQHLRKNTFWEPVPGKNINKYILFLDPSREAEVFIDGQPLSYRNLAVPTGPPKHLTFRCFSRFLSIFLDLESILLKIIFLYMEIEPGWLRNGPEYF